MKEQVKDFLVITGGTAIVAAAAALICGVGGICRHKKRHQS